jgi:hypothetical protein
MSLPLGTTGGIIGENEIDTALIPYLIKYLKSKKPLKIVISCQNDRIKELLEPYGSIDKISSLTLTLDRPYERIESELFSRNKRKLVNRGRRRGVIISRKKDSSTIDAYCSLQKKVEGQKGWATPFPEAFTRDMISLKEADLWTAWLDNKLTCAIVSFSYHKTATAWQGILDRDLKESLSAQPMNLLYASMIQYYQENRCDVFDMGYSLGIPSLELYKRGFGCKETPMYYFTWKSRLFKMLSFIKTVINYLKINRTKPASPLSQNSSDDTD